MKRAGLAFQASRRDICGQTVEIIFGSGITWILQDTHID
jgi:hypothetical protein